MNARLPHHTTTTQPIEDDNMSTATATRIRTLICTVAAMLLIAIGPATAQRLIHPISNPVYADTAIPKNQVTVFYAHHRLPDTIATTAGRVPLDGDVDGIAVQVEYAFNESLSLTAIKDGYLDFDPDATLNDEEGFADIALGLKWVFHRTEDLTMAVRGTVELTTGDDDVVQGNGDGNFVPSLLATHQTDYGQCNAMVAAVVPFDGDEESLTAMASLGYALRFTDSISPVIELNWFRVLDEGDGTSDFDGQLGTAVPTIVEFEGGDLFNLGAANADENPNLVTLGIGGRVQVNDAVSIGIGYEIPLTDDEESLIDDRTYVNLTWRF